MMIVYEPRMSIMMIIRDREGSLPFLAVCEVIEREQMRYVAVDGERCNLSNNPNIKDLDDPIKLYLM